MLNKLLYIFHISLHIKRFYKKLNIHKSHSNSRAQAEIEDNLNEKQLHANIKTNNVVSRKLYS